MKSKKRPRRNPYREPPPQEIEPYDGPLSYTGGSLAGVSLIAAFIGFVVGRATATPPRT